jgi:hypothetical protein
MNTQEDCHWLPLFQRTADRKLPLASFVSENSRQGDCHCQASFVSEKWTNPKHKAPNMTETAATGNPSKLGLPKQAA